MEPYTVYLNWEKIQVKLNITQCQHESDRYEHVNNIRASIDEWQMLHYTTASLYAVMHERANENLPYAKDRVIFSRP